MPEGIPRYRPTTAPALFSQGFRPFFLGAALWAAVSVAIWVPFMSGGVNLPTAFDPVDWHAHEMIYGFAVAAMAGFLLTAIPNWTGRLPLQGAPLIFLFANWCLGRIAMATSGVIGILPAAIVDMSFLVLLLGAATREVLAGRNWRNLPPLGGLLVLLVGNGVMHMQASALHVHTHGNLGAKLGLAVFASLIGLIGGRIIPSFTRNRLAKRAKGRIPAPTDVLDRIGAVLLPIAMVSWLLDIEASIQGSLLLAAGIVSGVRLARWRSIDIWRDAIVASLHVGYAWLAIGLCLLGLSSISNSVPEVAAVHVLGMGAIGTMIVSVMVRATLAHTGRQQIAGKLTLVVYGSVQVAVLFRIAAVLWPEAHMALIAISGVAWAIAFAVFASEYGAVLMQQRRRRGS